MLFRTVKVVHPRGHGEHDPPPTSTRWPDGSSPWARGTPISAPFYSEPYPVHPRGHGEHAKRKARKRKCYGSSPWARGTHTYVIFAFNHCRFIPVGTGNTHHLQWSSSLNTVHPRGHGEHPFVHSLRHPLIGSSPWARGTRPFTPLTPSITRFIPVGTGNT